MTNEFLFQKIKEKKSFLCVGLDVDLEKIPKHLLEEEDPIFSFSKAIIDSTHSYAVAYKPNLAFFEAYGIEGLKSFKKVERQRYSVLILRKVYKDKEWKSSCLF